jgi:hypothetical protein
MTPIAVPRPESAVTTCARALLAPGWSHGRVVAAGKLARWSVPHSILDPMSAGPGKLRPSSNCRCVHAPPASGWPPCHTQEWAEATAIVACPSWRSPHPPIHLPRRASRHVPLSSRLGRWPRSQWRWDASLPRLAPASQCAALLSSCRLACQAIPSRCSMTRSLWASPCKHLTSLT